MKRIWIFTLLVVLMLTGCSGPAEDPHPDWDESWVRIGQCVGVEPLEEFTPSESNDVLSVYGLYYATWTAGEGRDFVNADGEDTVAYDAKIYMLLQECRSAEAAQEAVGTWIAREKQNYEAGESDTKEFAAQEFELLPLLSGSETNPYTHGIAAFAARGEWAISVELVCSDGFAGDPQAILEQFLAGLHYE